MNTEVISKVSVFEKELAYIKNDSFKKDTKHLISLLPDYFFMISASSTGKYHPEFSQGAGGLVRHTKLAVRIAYELLNNDSVSSTFSVIDKDLILIALILHDGLKKGMPENTYTCFDHPILASEFINNHKNELDFNETELDKITSMIKSHMGQWNKDTHSNVVLDKPITDMQKFVHMCDYLSSKKFLDVKFDKTNNIID